MLSSMNINLHQTASSWFFTITLQPKHWTLSFSNFVLFFSYLQQRYGKGSDYLETTHEISSDSITKWVVIPLNFQESPFTKNCQKTLFPYKQQILPQSSSFMLSSTVQLDQLTVWNCRLSSQVFSLRLYWLVAYCHLRFRVINYPISTNQSTTSLSM